MWSAYNRRLASHPISTKALTVAGLGFVGDVGSQRLESWLDRRAGRPSHEYSVQRSLRVAAFGLVLSGPLNHFWYGALEKIVKGTGTRANVAKVALDQTIFAPFILTSFFTAMPVLEGQGLEAGINNAKAHLIPALKLNYFVWPAAQAINFRYIPLQHRVGYVSVILCFWNAVISYLHHQPHDDDENANVTKALE